MRYKASRGVAEPAIFDIFKINAEKGAIFILCVGEKQAVNLEIFNADLCDSSRDISTKHVTSATGHKS